MYTHMKSICQMYSAVFLALLFVVKGKSDTKDVVTKPSKLIGKCNTCNSRIKEQLYNHAIENIIVGPTRISKKCHNKAKEWRKHLYFTISYDVFLQNGKKVDSVKELVFKYGSKSVIQGINEGVYGMCEQEERFRIVVASKAGLERLESMISFKEKVILKIRVMKIDEFINTGQKKCNCDNK